jgi:NitT/TauT family transport system substrate-binding protein
MRRRDFLIAGATTLAAPAIVRADTPKIVIGMSGWTGFAPLTLAEDAGLFKANGLNATTKMVPQSGRNLALASGALNCVVTTVDTMITWASAGLPLVQVLVLDRSHGADGMAARPAITTVADLKGKTIATDGPGTTPYFVVAYVLYKNGLKMSDVTTATLEPQPAAQAFAAGRFDAASTYEPYLDEIRKLGPDKGHILVSTLQYPIVIDTLAFQPDFITGNRDAVKALVKSWFDALGMIASDPEKSYGLMGKRVNESGIAFKSDAAYLEWPDRAKQKELFASFLPDFMKDASAVLLETKVIRQVPDLSALVDPSFV